MNGHSQATAIADASSVAVAPVDRDLLKVARAAIAERVDVAKKSLCMVVALVDPVETTIVTHGRLSHSDSREPNQHTVFELGSIIKVFDALLLNEMAARGEVALMDPVERYLPADVKIPRLGQPITFQHLATHVSGLPGRQTHPEADRASATMTDLFVFLSTYKLTREVGDYYEYSNAGAALLRHVLAMRAGTDYETLLRTRIFAPLRMHSTVLTPTPEITARTATGHGDRLEVTPVNPAELRSTAHDLAIFIRFCLGLDRAEGPLARAVATMLSVRIPCGPRIEAAMGWNIETHGVDDLVCHDGVTWSFRAWIGYRSSVQRGAVVLSNASSVGGIVDIGYHLLDDSYPLLSPESPLCQPPAKPRGITLSAEALEKHVGKYQLTPNVLIVITRDGDQLFAEKPGHTRVTIYPESPLDFFCKDVDFFFLPADTRIAFKIDEDGLTTGLTLHQRGHNIWLPRVAQEDQGVWFGHKAMTVDPTVMQKYVGMYRMGDTTVAVTFEGGELISEFDNRLKVHMTPENEARFFIRNDVMDVQIEFEIDARGRVIGLVGTFDGQRKEGIRID